MLPAHGEQKGGAYAEGKGHRGPGRHACVHMAWHGAWSDIAQWSCEGSARRTTSDRAVAPERLAGIKCIQELSAARGHSQMAPRSTNLATACAASGQRDDAQQEKGVALAASTAQPQPPSFFMQMAALRMACAQQPERPYACVRWIKNGVGGLIRHQASSGIRPRQAGSISAARHPSAGCRRACCIVEVHSLGKSAQWVHSGGKAEINIRVTNIGFTDKGHASGGM